MSESNVSSNLRTVISYCVPLHFVLTSLLQFSCAHGEVLTWDGHLKYQLDHTEYDSEDIQALLGPDTSTNHSLDLRLNVSGRRNQFDMMLNGELLTVGGDANYNEATVAGRLHKFQSSVLPDDKRRLFDLTLNLIDEDSAQAVLRLDRASVGFLSKAIIVRAGRHAISWGNGLIFQVLDPFNPFSPTEIDRDYKPGDDMLYSQLLFANGDDIQTLIIPRRSIGEHAIMADESSFAVRWHSHIKELDGNLVIARHYDDTVVGGGLSHSIFEALMRMDVAVTDLEDSGVVWGVVVNIDRSWVVHDTNVYAFLEFFRNSVGVGDGRYADVSPALIDRVNRGELFTLSRSYLATGIRIEVSPLTKLIPSCIFNNEDKSTIFQIRLEHDWLQNVLITGGADIAFGDEGSEFGGIAIPDTSTFAGLGNQIYVKVSYFF